MSCGDCCCQEYPLEKLLNKIEAMLFGRRDCCEVAHDPCGYDLWPCVGQCCNECGTNGHGAAPALLDPEVLRPQGEEQLDPFRDDPNQPPSPPATPTRGVRSARYYPALQRIAR
jgi:hypothetical protein